jgi:hypothetical protein
MPLFIPKQVVLSDSDSMALKLSCSRCGKVKAQAGAEHHSRRHQVKQQAMVALKFFSSFKKLSLDIENVNKCRKYSVENVYKCMTFQPIQVISCQTTRIIVSNLIRLFFVSVYNICLIIFFTTVQQ